MVGSSQLDNPSSPFLDLLNYHFFPEARRECSREIWRLVDCAANGCARRSFFVFFSYTFFEAALEMDVRCSCGESPRHSNSLEEPVGDEIEIESPSMSRRICDRSDVQNVQGPVQVASEYTPHRHVYVATVRTDCRKEMAIRSRSLKIGSGLIIASPRLV